MTTRKPRCNKARPKRSNGWDFDEMQELRKRMRGTATLTNDYLYPLGHNFCMFVGVVANQPAWTKGGCWFRYVVPDLFEESRNFFVVCRAWKEKAQWILEHVVKGSEVAIAGRMWTGRGKRKNCNDNFTFPYLLVDNISSNIPVLSERDPRYVKVRRDIWNSVVRKNEELANLEVEEPEPLEASDLPPIEEPDNPLEATMQEGNDCSWYETLEDPPDANHEPEPGR